VVSIKPNKTLSGSSGSHTNQGMLRGTNLSLKSLIAGTDAVAVRTMAQRKLLFLASLGLGLSLLMRRSTKVVRNFVGTAVIGAWVLPEIVAAYLLSAFFNDDGTLNVMLHAVGLPGQDWLYAAPIIAVSLANIWRGTAFSMLVYSAALSEVPKEIEESAEMDGASGLRRLIFVTLPMITRAIMTNLMLITLQTLSVFGLIYAMTRGGPGTKSQTLPLYMYEQAFSFSQIGYGTAIALVMLAIGAVFSLVYLRGLNSEAA